MARARQTARGSRGEREEASAATRGGKTPLDEEPRGEESEAESSAESHTRRTRKSGKGGGRRRRRSEGHGDAKSPRETLGNFLRTQRRIAGLSLRQLADITSVSNAYLSQIERGLHNPSVDILRAVARGLNVSAETLLDQVGLFEDPPEGGPRIGSRVSDSEAAILADPRLNEAQRQALLTVYRSYVAETAPEEKP